jgi:membrane protease YdiL (CAAX protease family)
MQVTALAGSLFLYCAPFMVWWVLPQPSFDPNDLLGWSRKPEMVWPLSIHFLALSKLIGIGAGFGAILLCFTPRQNPAGFYLRRILPFTLPILLLHLFNHLLSRPKPESVFDDPSLFAAPVSQNLSTLLAHMGPGFYATVAGLALVGIAVRASRINSNLLPLGFAGTVREELSLRRKQMLRFILWVYALSIVAPFLVRLPVWVAMEFGGWKPGQVGGSLWWGIESSAQTLPVTLVGLWFLRRDSYGKSLFRAVPARYLLLSAVVPLLAYVVPCFVVYFGAEVAQYVQPRQFPFLPAPSEFFEMPNAWSLMWLAPALLEEIGWRGYLQRQMVAEFGLRRGLLLLGIAWAVWHLPGELGFLQLGDAGIGILWRFVSVFGILVPLGWLFARTGSVIPATILHALSNILRVEVGTGPQAWLVWMGIGHTAVLALCGYLLFKRWPVNEPQPLGLDPAARSEGEGTTEGNSN